MGTRPAADKASVLDARGAKWRGPLLGWMTNQVSFTADSLFYVKSVDIKQGKYLLFPLVFVPIFLSITSNSQQSTKLHICCERGRPSGKPRRKHWLGCLYAAQHEQRHQVSFIR